MEVLGVLRGVLNNLILVCDDSNLNTIRIRLDLNGLLEIVVDLLDTIEALNSMTFHGVRLIGPDRRNGLDEADHCSIAMSIKFIIVASFERLKFIRAVLSWILRDFWLNCILEIGQKA